MYSRRLLRDKDLLFGAVLIGALVLAACLAPWLSPHDPNEQALGHAYQPPAWLSGDPGHLLGTDSLGRDILSRLLYGSQVALWVAVAATSCSALIGVPVALFAGYYRGTVDEALMRVVDIWMSFPPVLLAVVLMTIWGVGTLQVILAIVLVDWTRFARVVRGEVFNLRERDFVEAARALGMSDWRIMVEEILPNLSPLLIILASLEMGLAVIVEALLSFVGLGVKAGTPSWGSMIAEGLGYFRTGWWGLAFPMAAIILVVLAFNVLGDGLRRRLDPRLTWVG
ncbi:MAG: ABC transporter permease [Chloroflexi bacterium]|nr:ABC transporter permease [Chloroflexota bacterium]